MTFDGRVLVIGLGSVSRCALPLLFAELPIHPTQYTVMDFDDVPPETVAWLRGRGAVFVTDRVTEDNHRSVLTRHVGPGDLIVDLSWNLDSVDLLDWCHSNGVRYVNASVEVWDPYVGFGREAPTTRTLYARHMRLREMFGRWGGNAGPSAVLDHGANPGLVSHFTTKALVDIAARCRAELKMPPELLETIAQAVDDRAWNLVARALGVQVIHISERDTQISVRPKQENEFVNTWSVEGFYEEGIAPAELGWGTHERHLPPGAHTFDTGPRHQICLAHPGFRTWVRSWVPCGEIIGMVIRHGEAFSITERLTVTDTRGAAAYRPTVHYAYCPADAAIASLHELHMKNYQLQPRLRIMDDDIVSGRDELGVLLMGHPFVSWWTGSLLDIEEARRLAPGQNATTLQVAAGVLGAAAWVLDHPDEGVRLPDDLPYEFVLEKASPYLGPMLSEPVDWTPLTNRVDPFGAAPADPADVCQFSSFLVRGADGTFGMQ